MGLRFPGLSIVNIVVPFLGNLKGSYTFTIVKPKDGTPKETRGRVSLRL